MHVFPKDREIKQILQTDCEWVGCELRDQVRTDGAYGLERESVGRDHWKMGRCGDLVQWKLPGLCEGDPNENCQQWVYARLLTVHLLLPAKASSVGTQFLSVKLLANGNSQTTQAVAQIKGCFLYTGSEVPLLGTTPIQLIEPDVAELVHTWSLHPLFGEGRNSGSY